MSDLPLFLFGAFITFIVLAALATLLWGAVEDGRTEERKGGEAIGK